MEMYFWKIFSQFLAESGEGKKRRILLLWKKGETFHLTPPPPPPQVLAPPGLLPLPGVQKPQRPDAAGSPQLPARCVGSQQQDLPNLKENGLKMKFSQRGGFGSGRLAKESPGSLGREHEMLKDVSRYVWSLMGLVCYFSPCAGLYPVQRPTETL